MEKKKANGFKNSVKIVGYLKENTLEVIENSKGGRAIRGYVIIATDRLNNHRVQYYVPEYLSNGDENKTFEALSELLPADTLTIASYLKANPEADYSNALEAATKVWAVGSFEEYARRTGERVQRSISTKGFRLGLAKADKAPFTPAAEFDIDVYLSKIDDELDENEEPTGRLLVEGYAPRYDNSVDVIDFVAVKEDGVAAYIKKNYKVGDTTNLRGDLISLAERREIESDETEYFGRQNGPTYETVFTRERRIVGGSKTPIHAGEEGCITKEFVKEALAEREAKMIKNNERAMAKAQNSPNNSSGEQKGHGGFSDKPKGKASVATDDLDF